MKNTNDNRENERAVNLTWTWYLFLIANVLIMIGIAITWGIYGKVGASTNVSYIPIIVCNIIAIVLMGLFYYFDSKEIYLVKQHVPRKNFNLYFSAGFIFIFNLIFVFVMMAFADKISASFSSDVKINVTFGIIFGVSALISLITIGIYRYAKYKIDLALYLRRRGEKPTEKEEIENKIEQSTSGIADNATSQ